MPKAKGGFNTQPPEGGWHATEFGGYVAELVSTHSRPKAAGVPKISCMTVIQFQHTAARRRLDGLGGGNGSGKKGFNTQPPEGGWIRFC